MVWSEVIVTEAIMTYDESMAKLKYLDENPWSVENQIPERRYMLDAVTFPVEKIVYKDTPKKKNSEKKRAERDLKALHELANMVTSPEQTAINTGLMYGFPAPMSEAEFNAVRKLYGSYEE